MKRMQFPSSRSIENIRETCGWLETHHDACVRALVEDNRAFDELAQKMAKEIRIAKKAAKNKQVVEALASALFAFENLYGT